MHIAGIDLNLLRLFEAVYRLRNVSQAAESLSISQPSASQGLARLRRALDDPLFVRAPGGVQPTPKAVRVAPAIQLALDTLEKAFTETTRFDPTTSSRVFRIHMSDIGETRFLPLILQALQAKAPAIRIETLPVPQAEISEALNNAHIDFAFGFLPNAGETRHARLLADRYVVLLRSNHPVLTACGQQVTLHSSSLPHAGKPSELAYSPSEGGRGLVPPTQTPSETERLTQAASPAAAEHKVELEKLSQLEFVAVRTHIETLRILQLLRLDSRLRLTTHHFMALPEIVGSTDLCAVMPRNLARKFAVRGGYAILEPEFPLRDFVVSLHWSARFENEPANIWFRQQVLAQFSGS